MSNEEMALAYRSGDHSALHALWMQVERLAVVMVRRYIPLARRNRAADHDDLMQAAFIGVERAARAYRPDTGSFVSVMGFYVKTEVATLLGLRGRVRREHYEAVSASAPLSEDGEATLLDTIPDDSLPNPVEMLAREDTRLAVRLAVGRLPVRQADVLRGYYLEGLQLAALAERSGVSVARAGQLKRDAERRMRKDRQLRELAEEALCFRHKGLAAFRRDWTSTTEAAVLARDHMSSKKPPG